MLFIVRWYHGAAITIHYVKTLTRLGKEISHTFDQESGLTKRGATALSLLTNIDTQSGNRSSCVDTRNLPSRNKRTLLAHIPP